MPPLEMVVVIITAVECGTKSGKLNSVVNAFTESKKLALSVEILSKVQVCKNYSKNTCPDLKVHSETMKKFRQRKIPRRFLT